MQLNYRLSKQIVSTGPAVSINCNSLFNTNDYLLYTDH